MGVIYLVHIQLAGHRASARGAERQSCDCRSRTPAADLDTGVGRLHLGAASQGLMLDAGGVDDYL
jgi:hypothetical protein